LSPQKSHSVPQVSTTAAPVSPNPLSQNTAAVAKSNEEKLKERAKRFGLPEPVVAVKKPKVADAGAIKSPISPHKTVSNGNSNVGVLKNESSVKFRYLF
jgi:hypothetical protein